VGNDMKAFGAFQVDDQVKLAEFAMEQFVAFAFPAAFGAGEIHGFVGVVIFTLIC